jgi:stearoyl-CoA desaturase (delta-9 desaturase)
MRLLAAITILVPCLGVAGAAVWGPSGLDLALLAGFYLVTQLGITAGYHRLLAHRSFETTPLVKTLLIVAGSMAAQGSLLFWVAAHRRHHRFSDRPGDPHSPHLGGFWHAHVGWMFSHEPGADWARSVPDLLQDDHVFRLNRQYLPLALAGLAAPAVIGGVASWSWQGALGGLLWGGLVRVFCAHHTTWAVNSVCHRFGARPHATRDRSRNVPLFALITLGESWHNNHHAQPRSARHGVGAWQLDPTYAFIWLLERAGMAWSVKRAT